MESLIATRFRVITITAILGFGALSFIPFALLFLPLSHSSILVISGVFQVLFIAYLVMAFRHHR
jgi:hypothetical protein